jgi:hypothetical protein
MKVKIRRFNTEVSYKENLHPIKETTFSTVTEALEVCKKEVRDARGDEDFLGLRIVDLKGRSVHKLHNSF